MSDVKSWLLISAPADGSLKIFPLGLGYISGALKSAGYRVTCLDLAHVPADLEASAIEAALRDSGAGVIGIGGLSNDWSRMHRVLDMASRVNPRIVKVIGGGGVSSDPETMIRTLDVHYGVLGEGEDTVVELAKAIGDGFPVDQIPGLAYRNEDGTLHRTAERRGTKDLDALPLPDFEGFNLGEYLKRQKTCSSGVYDSFHDNPKIMPIVFSRSCPFQCTFCFHAVSKYRTRSMDSIFNEIRYLVEHYEINTLGIYDDLFAVKRERVAEFCSRIKNMSILWSCQLRVDTVDDDLLRMMRDAGCYQISFGFESMSQRVLDSMNKKVKRHDIEMAAERTYRANIDIQGNFIFGDFAEDYESINETMTWWYNNLKYRIWVIQLDVYPGANIYNRAVSEGIITDGDEFLRQKCPQVNLTKIPGEQLKLFLDAINYANNAIRFPAFVLEGAVVPVDGEHRLSVLVECPHCGGHIRYAALPGGDPRLICKECRGRFDFPLTRLSGRPHPEDLTALTQQAIDLIGAGRFGEAIPVAVAGAQRGDADAWHALGVALLKSGQSLDLGNGARGTALGILRGAGVRFPDSASIQANLAAAYLAEGWLGFGLLHASQALRLDPDLAENRHNFALADSLAREGGLIRFMPAGDAVAIDRLQIVLPKISVPGNVARLPPLKKSAQAAAMA
ncbi:MAG: cobalamin-dependent protein [Alphaproteobacteria bacterium]|nr:cobalamin-dependent protein [Alphaproteobacteria bacterium]